MAEPLDPQKGLARAFAEFWLLPDLLARVVPGDALPPSWRQLLERNGYAIDHIEDDELPSGPDRASIMAEDAWRISQWLELVDAGGLTDAGRQIADVARTAQIDRSEAVWAPADEVLANQIRECYLGADGERITDRVLAGARVLEGVDDAWARFCPGLLLVEFEALVYLSHTDPPRAADLVGELPFHRRAAMRDFSPPRPGVENILHMAIHADAVSRYYMEDLPEYVNDRVLTVTAISATAILFAFCGLLITPMPHFPVQYLVPRDA